MKKKFLSIFALIFCVALIFTGCATVSGVKDSEGKSIYFDEAVHFGGHIAQIGDYVYYGNAYVATTDSGFKYKDASQVAYLTRIKNGETFTFGEDVKDVNKQHTSPNEIEKVNGAKLVGYENQDMYALGSYLYFTSANVHKTNDMKNDYSQISLFRIKFDGDSLEEIATFKSDNQSKIELTKGSDNAYYFVAYAPSEDGHAIYSVKVGDSIGKVTTLVEEATSVAIADVNSSEKNVIYTVESEKEFSRTSVMAVDIVSGESTPLDSGVAGSTTKLIDREGDIVFYSYKNPENNVEEVYYKEITPTSTNFSPVNRFYNAKSITNIEKAYNGFIFKTTSSEEGDGALVFKTLDGTKKLLRSSTEAENVLFADDDYVYISTESSISRISLVDYQSQTIVSGLTMIAGMGGYADGYVYFYAQLGELEKDDVAEDEEETEEEEKDENYYMYRADMAGNIQLIGKTAKK